MTTDHFKQNDVAAQLRINKTIILFRDPECIDFCGLDSPGGSRNHSNWNGSWGPRGPSRPPKSMMYGSRMIMSSWLYKCEVETSFGDLGMWLQLMWLQFEVVRGPVGVVWGRFGPAWGPKDLKPTPSTQDKGATSAPGPKSGPEARSTGNRSCERDLGRMLIGRASKSALRPAGGPMLNLSRQESSHGCYQTL